jgi:hypothetical protein
MGYHCAAQASLKHLGSSFSPLSSWDLRYASLSSYYAILCTGLEQPQIFDICEVLESISHKC